MELKMHTGGLVKRKGNKISCKLPLHKEAARWLDAYLYQRSKDRSEALEEDVSLIVSHYGNRLLPRDIYRLCQQALAQLLEEDKMWLTPHFLFSGR